MIKWRCCLELVQFYGFRSVEVLLRWEARRTVHKLDQSVEACQFLHGEAKVVSKTRSVQSSPVKSSIGFWPSLMQSTSYLSAKNTVSYNQLIAELFSCRVLLLGSWIMAGGRLANAECLDDIAKLWILRYSGISFVALGKDDRIAWCWTLGPPV
ncbi:hypothetical protein YC2023_033350 [Brassica napus]